MLPQALLLSLCVACALSAPQAVLQLPPGVDPSCLHTYPICPLTVVPIAAPADVDITRCVAFPFCDTVAAHNPAGPNGVFPANVDPTSCPGYPFHHCTTTA